jgi:hypothetical protein
MGNNSGIEALMSQRKAESICMRTTDLLLVLLVSFVVQPAMHELQVEWARAKGEDVKNINWKKTEIDFPGFKQLMDPSWSEKDLKSLFSLYDVDGNGKISWREYVCVCLIVSTLPGSSVHVSGLFLGHGWQHFAKN